MMQDSLRSTLDAYADIIEGVEDLEIAQKNVVSRIKAKLRLFDGSMLWVREVWVKEEMVAYSYYWLRADETVLMGWDNAPHHKGVKTFPHHKHIGDRVEDSEERDMRNVLEFIKNFLA